jgi:hypothetical protein
MSTQGWVETLITSQIDGAALTAAAAASAIPAAAKFTLPANFFSVGKVLKVEAAGRISTVITTPGTARFDVRFGGTAVFDGLAMLLDTAAGHTNMPWHLEILMTCRVIGAAASLMGVGKFTSEVVRGAGTMPLGVMTAMLPWNSAPAVGATFDSTATQAVDLFFTQTVATGSMTCHQYALTVYN